jgi:U3 small nucleolar RNA-associated protein 14
MGRLKSLLFRQEIKNRRIAKIKSKLYHKLKKKERDREETKLRQYMMEVDPEAAKAYQEKLDLKLVEERLRARHGTGTKYAKNLKRFRGMDDKQTRDAYHQAVLDRQALTKRQQKIGSESESDEGSDSDDYSVDDAIDEMKAEIS